MSYFLSCLNDSIYNHLTSGKDLNEIKDMIKIFSLNNPTVDFILIRSNWYSVFHDYGNFDLFPNYGQKVYVQCLERDTDSNFITTAIHQKPHEYKLDYLPKAFQEDRDSFTIEYFSFIPVHFQ